MANENRFSLLQLEKDVLKYVEYRKKYQYFDNKLSEPGSQEEKAMNKENRDYWYNKYIKKMAYLERSYRRTNVYTNYHRQLENPYYNLPQVPTHDVGPLPSAPPAPVTDIPVAEIVPPGEEDPPSIILGQPIPE